MKKSHIDLSKDVQYLFPGLVDRPKEKLEFERENIVYQSHWKRISPGIQMI